MTTTWAWTASDDMKVRQLVDHGYSEFEMEEEFPAKGRGEIALRIEHLGALDRVHNDGTASAIKDALAHNGSNLDEVRAAWPDVPMSVILVLVRELEQDIADGFADVAMASFRRAIWTSWIDSGLDRGIDDIADMHGGEDFGATREAVESIVKNIAKQLVVKMREHRILDERELDFS